MLVRCPKCETGFNLDVEKIPAKGAKLRCSACGHGFRVRVESDGKLVAAERGAAVTGDQTQVGGLFEANTSRDNPKGGVTPAGRGRSKSAVAGYDPFPLAKKVSARKGNETQLFGSASSEPEDDDDSLDSIELFDADLEEVSERTQLGPQALTGGSASAFDERNNQTMLSASGRSSTVVETGGERPVSALDPGALDLFDDFDMPDANANASQDLSDDFDPFGDAFSDVLDADTGLLMPSTPSIEEKPRPRHGFDEVEESGLKGMSPEAFFRGGQRSDFGPVESLVDPSFGEDVAVFDPGSGMVEAGGPSAAPTRKASRRGASDSSLDLGLDLDLAPAPAAASKQMGRRSEPRIELPEPEPRRPSAQPRAVARQAPALAPHQIGATSTVRRVFDILFIAVIVIVGFIAIVAVRADGFVDFTRFGHMLEVAFEGRAFEPRPEWARVVENAPVEPPPDQPLRLENVRASELSFDKERVLIIAGTLRNYSSAQYEAVNVRAEIVDRDGKIVAEQTVPAGRFIDREKVASVSTPAGVEKLVEEKVDDIGADGAIPFTVVFTGVPRVALDAGKLDYRVAVVE